MSVRRSPLYRCLLDVVLCIGVRFLGFWRFLVKRKGKFFVNEVSGPTRSKRVAPNPPADLVLYTSPFGRPGRLHLTTGRPGPLHLTPGRPGPLHFTPADLVLYTSHPPADLVLYTSPPAYLVFYTSPPADLVIYTSPPGRLGPFHLTPGRPGPLHLTPPPPPGRRGLSNTNSTSLGNNARNHQSHRTFILPTTNCCPKPCHTINIY